MPPINRYNRKVDTSILNDKKQAPVHLATEINRVEALSRMGKYREQFDIQQGGEHGRTPLHLAAIYDHDECARILVRVVDGQVLFSITFVFSSSFAAP